MTGTAPPCRLHLQKTSVLLVQRNALGMNRVISHCCWLVAGARDYLETVAVGPSTSGRECLVFETIAFAGVVGSGIAERKTLSGS